MKRIACVSVILLAALAFSNQAQAQIWKHIKKKVKSRVEQHVVNDVGHATDKAMDKTEHAAIKSLQQGENDQQQDSAAQSSTTSTKPAPAPTGKIAAVAPASNIAAYKNYDFVPGDKIIFQTDFKAQQDAELPARLGILNGNAEVQTYQGKKALHIGKGEAVCVTPLMDSTNYLPNQYTVEFDFLYNGTEQDSPNQLEVDFYHPNRNNEFMKDNYGDYHFFIYAASQVDFGRTVQTKKLSENLIQSLKTPGLWHHIALYYHDNVGKAYIDQYRVSATNMMPKGATKLAIKTDGELEYLVKNIRIAGGGSDAYHKIMTDGKLITHGIHFASGKADILPESMGTINEVYKVLKDHPALKFEIDGYTDSDGSADLNMKLSQNRAEAVRKQLTNMGIDKSRLTAKGFGETKPMANNDTPEGKASNRRVEFVKK